MEEEHLNRVIFGAVAVVGLILALASAFQHLLVKVQIPHLATFLLVAGLTLLVAGVAGVYWTLYKG